MKDEDVATFEQNRSTLEGVAYRMLGSVSDARDTVQETWLKWQQTDSDAIENPRAWLILVCSRIALNRLNSAQSRRELYVGDWLPEPFLDQDISDPSKEIELDQTVSVALFLAMEKLSPSERAAFLLHDVFDLSFDEIAIAIGKSSTNCRQLAARARKRVRDERPRFQTSASEHMRLLGGFISAAKEGNLEQLISLLAEDVELYTDSGGKVEAPPRKVTGSSVVARFFVSIFDRHRLEPVFKRINGSPGVLLYEQGGLATVLTLDADTGQIQRLYAVRNPDKFSALQ